MQTDEITEQSTDPITLDEVIGRIVSGRFTHQENLTMLNKLTTQQLTSYTLDGLDPLTVINPATFSLAYLYFITARCLEATENNGLHLFQMLHHFIQVFEVEQVQLAPSRFSLVGKALLYLTEVMQKPLLPLQTFKLAINRFSNNNLHELTSLHAPFLQACILAKAYRFPLDILTQDIEIIDPKKNDIDIQGFLEYFYYGAIIYIGNKRFGDALDSLSIVISAPIQKAISAIQIAAYKKYVLVSLIWDGRLRALPKYTAQGVEKMCKMQATPYINLVKAFHDTSIEKFQEIVNKSSVFEDDQHIGLVKQCFEALRRKKIKELTRVYITVELKEMAEKIGDMTIEELELILIDMIHQKQIMASISITDQHIKMVHFGDEQEQQLIDLETILKVTNLTQRIALMDKLEGLNKDFQARYLTLSANSGGQLSTTTSYEEDFDVSLDNENKMFL